MQEDAVSTGNEKGTETHRQIDTVTLIGTGLLWNDTAEQKSKRVEHRIEAVECMIAWKPAKGRVDG